ncbi:P-loop NTPase [Glutamicibacter sp. 287]|uniref:P-loop NTPase n=1 Tax=Glutamicibacter sp. 287 TaxID=3457732 RepID=UPI0040336A46
MFDLKTVLSAEQFNSYMEAIALGKYMVLLGAGASYTSRNRYGDEIPGTIKLTDNITREFQVPSSVNADLKRVFRYAKDKQGRNGRSLSHYMVDNFTQTSPADWYQDFLQINWKMLWSLNVDDCVEVAHRQLGAKARQKLFSISWHESAKASSAQKMDLLLVHLHGKARSSVENMIFDVSQYVSSVKEQYRWLKVFGDDFPHNPFVILGAGLIGEFDLDETISKRTKSDIPSLIVLKDIDPLSRDEYERNGLIPIEANVEDFIQSTREYLYEYEMKIQPNLLREANGMNESFRLFSQQWKELKIPVRIINDKKHDLFAGHAPDWSDALNGKISRRAISDEIIIELTDESISGQNHVVFVHGAPFSGKSSLKYQVSKKLLDKNYQVFELTGEGSIDPEALSYWVNRIPKSIFIIDNAADFSREIETMLSSNLFENSSLRVLLIERDSRRDHLRSSIVGFEVKIKKIPEKLSRNDVKLLLSSLKTHKALGVLGASSDEEKLKFFAEYDNKLFSTMAKLSDGRGFRHRIEDEMHVVTSRSAKRLLSVVGLTNFLGYALPSNIIASSTDISPKEVDHLIETELGDLVTKIDGGISAHHRIFGELFFDMTDADQQQDAVISLGISLAPHVNSFAIRDNSIHYRILRSLMSYKSLLTIFNNDYDRVLSIYETLEEANNWNARFWEQRALCAAEARRFEKAIDWSYIALDRRTDHYSLNTIGTVRMKWALDLVGNGFWPSDQYQKAVQALNDAYEHHKDSNEAPFVTFFNYTNSILEKGRPAESLIVSEVQSWWTLWMSRIMISDERTRIKLEPLLLKVRKYGQAHGTLTN